jgi:hypothetical protein
LIVLLCTELYCYKLCFDEASSTVVYCAAVYRALLL